MITPTAIYRLIMCECERRRTELGWPMWQVDDKAGTQDGYYSKMLYPNSPNGRQARWETLQLVIDALFGDGMRLFMQAENQNMIPALPPSGPQANAQMVRHWRHTHHFRELGKKGMQARLQSATPTEIARRAAKARWKRERERRRAERAAN